MAYKKKSGWFKRTAKKVEAGLGKRYFKGKKANFRNANVVQMWKDIQKIKHTLNTEKKTLLIEEREPITMGLTTYATKTSASIDGEAIYAERDSVYRSGAYLQPNLIGTMTQGVADGQIVGERAKIVSYHMDYRIKAIEGTGTSISWGKTKTKVRLFLVMMPRGDQVLTDGTTVFNTQETLLSRFCESSVFDDSYDGTRRNIEFMKDFKVLSSKTVYFNHNEDNDNASAGERHPGIYEGKFGGKCNYHIRYSGDKLIKNQLAMIAIPDAGAVAGTTTDPNHFTLEYSMKLYYVDN